MVIVIRVKAMILLINLTLNLPYSVDGGLPHGRGRPSAPYFPSQVHHSLAPLILFVLDMKFSIQKFGFKMDENAMAMTMTQEMMVMTILMITLSV